MRWLLIFLAMAGLAGCNREVPEGTAERLEFVKARLAESGFGIKDGFWLAYLADRPTPETRAFFLKLMKEEQPKLIGEALVLINTEEWLEDQSFREAIRDYYQDENRSLRVRFRVNDHIILKWRDKYPEFQGLPLHPKLPEGLVWVQY